jgi:prolycopene isomerase
VNETYRLGLLYFFRWRDTPRLDPYRDLTVGQMLDEHFKDPKLKLLLVADGPHWGSPPNRTSFIFDSMLRLSYFLGNYYPVGGSQVFADELAQRFEERGGHILMNSTVKRILVENKRVTGIEVETGPKQSRFVKRVKADVVVSNADLMQTLEKMLNPDQIDPAYMAHVRELRPTHPCFLTHIGLKGVPTETLYKAQGYYWNEWDPNLLAQNGLKFKIFIPTLFEPKLAPPGGHVVIMQKVLDMDYYKVTNWASHKASVERYILDNLEKIIQVTGHSPVVALPRLSYRLCRWPKP